MKECPEISPVEFGAMRAELAALRREVNALSNQTAALVAVAERGRGALWLALAFGSVFGGVAAVVTRWILFMR